MLVNARERQKSRGAVKAATEKQELMRAPLSHQWSALGQTEKNSVRANVFRFALELRHCLMTSALRICATFPDSCTAAGLFDDLVGQREQH
jgi:hypothetical protein